jgi:hypothetical protein
MQRPGPPGWGLGAGLTIQPRKKFIVKEPQKGEARARLGLQSHMMMIPTPHNILLHVGFPWWHDLCTL